ncbi:hypothetical protein MLD38_031309 [Melastoma candidum]|uniref:Uncharacterized protein n=1 Tax=Melastoma candidum TaxID=119954 RepID=A0ACB9MST7_9MYRT|nr:hypothetical protein MLD38_031309 [Melastoma candidum]
MDGQTEVSAIVSIWHTYLTRLYCYCCVPDGPRFLLYEFKPKGSLDWWIFTESGMMNRPRGCLSWSLRYRAAVDVAKVLAYLHHDCRFRVLHLNVKPQNILLDGSYRAIVLDSVCQG